LAPHQNLIDLVLKVLNRGDVELSSKE